MVVKSRPVLPPELSERLSSIGARLHDGLSQGELRDVLDHLSELPSNQIARASREIAAAAGLGWWQPVKKSWPHPLFGRPISAKDLLEKNADYAWIFQFHHDGYVREAALDAIKTPPVSPFFFAALAWRLNDWVAPVRQAARRCAERVLPLAGAEITADAALHLLDRRFSWRRWSDEAEVLDAVFSGKAVAGALAVLLGESVTGRLATCLRYALRYPNMDQHLAKLAASAVQPAVRAVAYQCLLTGRASWPVGFEWAWIDKAHGIRRRVLKLGSRAILISASIDELIRQGVSDRSPKVRCVAADALTEARAQLPDADRLIRQLAADQSSAVRSRADYMLRHPTTHPA